MVISWIFTGMVLTAIIAASLTGNGGALAAAIPQGAQAGITLIIGMAGSVCLWSGIGKLMETIGVTAFLARILKPLLSRLFPSSRQDHALSGYLSANICANLLGLGNAATPMGLQAAQRLSKSAPNGAAGDELCRLIVLNSASIQLIPTTISAVRASLGCSTPFDILPAVWITSFCSAAVGLGAAWLFGKRWRK